MNLRYSLAFLIWLMSFRAVLAQGNWELLMQTPTSNQMAGMYFIDSQTGWAVGQYGTLLKSINGGNTWSIREIPWLFDLSDVYFPTVQIGYAIGTDGFLIKSTDGGDTWIPLESGYSNNLNRVLFLDEMIGWVIGEKGLILHTEDGGTSWIQQTRSSRPIRDHLLGIDLVGTDKLCIVGEREIIVWADVTDDDWENRTVSISPHQGVFSFEDVYFADELHGWVCGYDAYRNGVILASSDGGLQWQQNSTEDVTFTGWNIRVGSIDFLEPLQQIFFYDDLKTGLALTKTIESWQQHVVYKTTDGGKNWRALSEGNPYGFVGAGRFCVLPDNRVIMTGYNGDYRYSEDQGGIFRMPNHDRRWWKKLMMGDDGQLLALQDYTETDLTKVTSSPSPSAELRRVIKSYRSNDHGTTWQSLTPRFYNSAGLVISNDSDSLRGSFKSHLVHRDTLWIIHHDTLSSEAIFYSADWGSTYHEVLSKLDQEPWFLESRFLTPDTLIRYFLPWENIWPNIEKSVLFFSYSVDGGETFNQIQNSEIWNDITPTPPTYENEKAVNDHYFFDGSIGFLVGSEGNIIKTTDLGQTWASIFSGVVEDLHDIEFLNHNTGFVVGDFGRILKTEDGGETWRKTDSGTQENIYSIGFINSNEGWAGTETGLRYTVNGGETWQGIPLRYKRGRIEQIFFDNDNHGYAYTMPSSFDDSYVHLLRMKYGITDVANNRDSQRPSTITLSQNYPNPFNPYTTIQFKLPKATRISLTIYNVRGKVIKSLIQDQKIEAGTHEVLWDGTDSNLLPVASGIYFYQIKAKQLQQTKRCILLK